MSSEVLAVTNFTKTTKIDSSKLGGMGSKNGSSPASVVKIENEPVFSSPSISPRKLNFENLSMLFVDVIVNNAVSPVNFNIQSYRQSENLKRLENEMTSFYNGSEKILPKLQFSQLVLYGFYAVKYKTKIIEEKNGSEGVKSLKNKTQEKFTERWVRCQVKKPFSEKLPILTHLVDHGVFYSTEPESLQLLKKDYLEMPIQSYEAKLHFIDASQIQFSPADCIRFHSQVEGQKLCGIIVDKTKKDEKNGHKTEDTRLSIILVDTSKEKDLYIHREYLAPKKTS